MRVNSYVQKTPEIHKRPVFDTSLRTVSFSDRNIISIDPASDMPIPISTEQKNARNLGLGGNFDASSSIGEGQVVGEWFLLYR